MHYTIYTSADNEELYNFGTIEDYNLHQLMKYNSQKEPEKKEKKEDNICIICWYECNIQPYELRNHYKHYVTNCNCNTTIHLDCLVEWYDKTKSCPICRKLIIYDILYTQRSKIHYKLAGCCDKLYKYTLLMLRLVAFISITNVLFIVVYEIYMVNMMNAFQKYI